MSTAVETLAPVAERADTLVGDAWRRFRRNRLALVGLVIVALIVTAAMFAPWLAPYDPAKQTLFEKRARPGGKYVLGADEFGRDILSRVIYGARVALVVGLVSVGIALGLGLVLGSLAGFLGGWVDSAIMRGVEVLLAFPYLLLAIAVVSALGPGRSTPRSRSGSGARRPSPGSSEAPCWPSPRPSTCAPPGHSGPAALRWSPATSCRTSCPP